MDINNEKELQEHWARNEKMWEIWKSSGVKPDSELTVNFHFYSSKKEGVELLVKELKEEKIPYSVKETRTLIFFKGWKVSADVTKRWTLQELQGKTGNMFIMALQTGTLLEGCGALMPS